MSNKTQSQPVQEKMPLFFSQINDIENLIISLTDNSIDLNALVTRFDGINNPVELCPMPETKSMADNLQNIISKLIIINSANQEIRKRLQDLV